jgi:NADPH:quinone reductase-like Zn-dependent oxidoreductase
MGNHKSRNSRAGIPVCLFDEAHAGLCCAVEGRGHTDQEIKTTSTMNVAWETMEAIVYRHYGSPDVLNCEDIEKPRPAEGQVLIKVRAASLNPLDWRVMRGRPLILHILMGLRNPKTPGRDVAGEVEAIGRNVTQFKPGNEVFGTCDGSLAEYACASESRLAIKPARVSFEQAASVPVAALTALQGLRDHGKIQAGQKVLINGASGGVGTFAVQIAKSFGADVTGVCSTRNVEMVRSLGADRVMDYTHEDFTKGTQRYDIILDNVGNHSLAAYRCVLRRKGRLVIAGGPREIGAILARALQARALSRFVSQDLGFFAARISTQDLTVMGELMTTGHVTPVIDRRYRLSDVAEAMRYLEEGHARGKIVISLG